MLIKKKIKLYAFCLLYVICTILYMCGGEYMSLSAVYNHTYTHALTHNHTHVLPNILVSISICYCYYIVICSSYHL